MAIELLARRRVLVVEDDYDIRHALTELLVSEGYDAVGLANGREALEHLRAFARPAVILLDLMMPVMDGWQFLRERRSDPVLASIPVVVLSADRTAIRKLSDVGAAVVEKPFELDALLNTLARCA